MSERFDYSGDPALRERVDRALHKVIDPEMAVDIVELGLLYSVDATARFVKVRMTMTSAACPVAELIVDEIHHELGEALPGVEVDVEVAWDPPWAPERMSDRARSALAWD